MIIGITAGVFDLVHAGHIDMFAYAKRHCDFLVVCVQVDPSKYRAEKDTPVETVYERFVRLEGCKYVDKVIPYETEEDLENICRSVPYNIRFIGADHMGHSFTGDNIRQDTHHFNPREHQYSSSSLKRRIKEGRKETKRPEPVANAGNVPDEWDTDNEEGLRAETIIAKRLRKERKGKK